MHRVLAGVVLVLAGCGTQSAAPADPPAPTARTIDLAGYDRSCATDADCEVVNAYPCSPCTCPQDPIATKEHARFAAAHAAITCGPPPADEANVACGSCMPATTACEAGTCVRK